MTSNRQDNRGQILLIAAFTLAVTFVALALVVNSAIFTENLASRGEVAGSSEALSYQHQVRQSVGEAIWHANKFDYATQLDLEGDLDDSVDTLSETGGSQQATGGQLVHVDYATGSAEFGFRIADNMSGGSEFLNESTPASSANWQLADNVEDTRNVRINITDTNALATNSMDAFRLQAEESPSDIWEMRVWRTGGDVVVEVETSSGTSEECRIPRTDPFVIDVTDGVVDGQRCHALTRSGAGGDPMWWGSDLPSGPYEIWIDNGDAIWGNYSMIVDGSPNGDNLDLSPTSGDDPYFTDAIYSAPVSYVFESTQITYETEIEVAPGEPPS